MNEERFVGLRLQVTLQENGSVCQGQVLTVSEVNGTMELLLDNGQPRLVHVSEIQDIVVLFADPE